MRAVTARQLLKLWHFFRDLIRHRTAYYLNSNIIMPMTKAHQMSYAEFVGPSRLVYFVSHFWGSPFSHFVGSIQGHAEYMEYVGGNSCGKLSYWICFLSNNQWAVAEELGHGVWKESSFYKALRSGSCEATCMVLDEDASALSRLWCIFEVLQTFRMQHDSTFANFQGLTFSSARGVIGDARRRDYDIGITLAARLAMLRLEDAHASDEGDERMIRALVANEGGMQSMDAFVRGNMLTTLRCLLVNFEQEADTAKRELQPPPRAVAVRAPPVHRIERI